jgi:ABC-type nickel/cobalt efflux system permease component RcnA
LVLALLSLGGVGLMSSAPASAHPLGNFTVNVYTGVTVVPGEFRVLRVLDMAEIPTYQEMPSIDTNGDGTASAAERSAWAAREASGFGAAVSIDVNGSQVTLSVVSSSMRFRPGQAGLPILRLVATYRASAPSTGRVTLTEHTYSDRIGWREMTAVGANGEAVGSSSIPTRSLSDTLLAYPKALLSSPLRVTHASFSFHPGVQQGETATTGAPPSDGQRPGVIGGSFANLVDRSGSLPVVALCLLLAMGFGALHAVAPGHGKTIMAAYLVGAGGRVRQALAGGVAISLMHTASVLAIGGVVLWAQRFIPPEQIYPWLGLASGVVVVGLGAVLLVVRTRGRRHNQGHDHDVHGHSHDHSTVDPSRSLLSRKGLAALAVSGGLLPSPTALVVLLASVAIHRVAFGLALIVAFSVGLAGALTTVGVVAIRARDLFARRLTGRLANALPVGSAAVIFAAGAVLLARAAVQL